MGYLIKGKTPDEIKDRAKCCAGAVVCHWCKYDSESESCTEVDILESLLAYIEHLESERDGALAKALKWVDAKVELPKVDGEYLAYVICPKGRWMETLKFERYDDCHRWIKEIDYAYVEEATDFVVAWAVADLPEGIAE